MIAILILILLGIHRVPVILLIAIFLKFRVAVIIILIIILQQPLFPPGQPDGVKHVKYGAISTALRYDITTSVSQLNRYVAVRRRTYLAPHR